MQTVRLRTAFPAFVAAAHGLGAQPNRQKETRGAVSISAPGFSFDQTGQCTTRSRADRLRSFLVRCLAGITPNYRIGSIPVADTLRRRSPHPAGLAAGISMPDPAAGAADGKHHRRQADLVIRSDADAGDHVDAASGTLENERLSAQSHGSFPPAHLRCALRRTFCGVRPAMQ